MSRYTRGRYGYGGYGYGVDDRDYGYGYAYAYGDGGYGYGDGGAMDGYGGGVQDAYADYYASGAEEQHGLDPYNDDDNDEPPPLRNRSRSRSPPRRAYHSTSTPSFPRLPSPPPPPPPASLPPSSQPQTSPTKTYLHTSLAPSHPLPSPTDSRKLLILDLNGTLLIRAARHVGPNSARYRLHPHPHSNSTPDSTYTQGRLRPVNPRPYMPTLRAYLFHKRTKEWLDTMVWSSAQPHSVKDMVGRCFGEAEGGEGENGGLVAVWARDTLGLTQGEYNRKTQTTKDLSKPWAQLPLFSSPHATPSSSSSQPQSQPQSQSEQPPKQEEEEEPSPQPHSAKTTLLLDDSPRKAHLQPFNHVCVREYDALLRARDLGVLERGRGRVGVKEREREMMKCVDDVREGDDGNDGRAVVGEDEREGEVEEGEVGGKEKGKGVRGKKKKERKRNGDRVGSLDGTPAHAHAQLQPQIPTPPPTTSTDHPAHNNTAPSEDNNTDNYTQEADEAEDGYDPTLLAIIGILDEIRGQSNVAGWIRAGGLWGPFGSLAPSSSFSVAGGDGSTGNDADVTSMLDIIPADQDPNANANATAETEAEGGEDEMKMWFDYEPTFRYWVRRGRGAVDELGVELVHGVVG